jgi:murein DD-endopeptidase MepM/ murein hydrolase activator NlpD
LITIDHGNGVLTYYAHCYALYKSVGEYVNQGDIIAAVGNTGNSTGPHLHIEVRVNGVAYNPINYFNY